MAELAGEGRVDLLDLSLPEVEQLLLSLGQPAFRARQAYQWMYQDLATDISGMTNLPKSVRDKLQAVAYLGTMAPASETVSEDGFTRKVLLRLSDDHTIESVLMLYLDQAHPRRTVCASSQVGCALGCTFCATARGGFERNLTTGEIVGQVLYFARFVRSVEGEQAHITNLVMMGQGEPLANFDAVWKAIEVLNSPYGLNLGARHVTVSTVGIVPRIRELAQKHLQVGLAVSLHAPTDALRSLLVPANRTYPIQDVLSACREYIEQTHRRVTFEYVMIDDLNDSVAQARQLAGLLKGMLCHVNLIPINPVEGCEFRPAPPARILAFETELRRHGITTTLRVERGTAIDAACGQLRSRAGESGPGRRADRAERGRGERERGRGAPPSVRPGERGRFAPPQERAAAPAGGRRGAEGRRDQGRSVPEQGPPGVTREIGERRPPRWRPEEVPPSSRAGGRPFGAGRPTRPAGGRERGGTAGGGPPRGLRREDRGLHPPGQPGGRGRPDRPFASPGPGGRGRPEGGPGRELGAPGPRMPAGQGRPPRRPFAPGQPFRPAGRSGNRPADGPPPTGERRRGPEGDGRGQSPGTTRNQQRRGGPPRGAGKRKGQP